MSLRCEQQASRASLSARAAPYESRTALAAVVAIVDSCLVASTAAVVVRANEKRYLT